MSVNGTSTARCYASFGAASAAEKQKLWVIGARDLARGFCGALGLALPLYTLAMWERARVISDLIVSAAYFGGVGCVLFTGFTAALHREAAWFDARSGIGLLAGAATLLIGRYSSYTPGITVRLLPCFGARLAINQLGARSRGGDKHKLAATRQTLCWERF